jgi:hypothetical protein
VAFIWCVDGDGRHPWRHRAAWCEVGDDLSPAIFGEAVRGCLAEIGLDWMGYGLVSPSPIFSSSVSFLFCFIFWFQLIYLNSILFAGFST